jgi:hypothetical protein
MECFFVKPTPNSTKIGQLVSKILMTVSKSMDDGKHLTTKGESLKQIHIARNCVILHITM